MYRFPDRPSFRRSALTVLLVAATPTASGQTAPAPPPPVDAATREVVVEEVSRLVAERYIFADVAEEIAVHLRSRLADGAYDEATDPFRFCELLTADLRSVNADLHLGINPVPPGAMAAPDSDDEDARGRAIEAMARRNFGFQKVEILPGNVGYLDLRGFNPAEHGGRTAVAAMNFLANADAIIIDLRFNGGGDPSMIQLISSYFFEEATHLNSFEHRGEELRTQFWTLPYVPGEAMYETPLYVLTSDRTFSAAEEFSYNMRNLERATLVGETTGGGAHPGERHLVAERFAIFIPDGRAINPISGTNWEGVGVEPHIACAADDALAKAQMEALKTIRDDASDPLARAQYAFAINRLAATIDPVTIDEPTLRRYAGDYGPRRLSFADGTLTYSRDDNPPRRLVPLSNRVFVIEGIEFFQLEVVLGENGEPVKLIGHYDDGRTDESPRDGG